MSLGRFCFHTHMEAALETMAGWSDGEAGDMDNDVDSLREMLTETHPILLAVTLAVSTIHLLFDALAIKSDVQFWDDLKTPRGKAQGARVACGGARQRHAARPRDEQQLVSF